MESPEKVIRYQKHNVDFRIFADTPEFIESCDKDFEGMDDVTRTEYVRADLLAAKEKELREAEGCAVGEHSGYLEMMAERNSYYAETEELRAELAAKDAELEKLRTHLRELLGVKVLGRYDTAELFELIGIVGERLVSEARAAFKGVE